MARVFVTLTAASRTERKFAEAMYVHVARTGERHPQNKTRCFLVLFNTTHSDSPYMYSLFLLRPTYVRSY